MTCNICITEIFKLTSLGNIMANADQLLSFIRSHIDKDDNQFLKIALQISAVEAKAGHTVLARSINDLVNEKKSFRPTRFPNQSLTLSI